MHVSHLRSTIVNIATTEKTKKAPKSEVTFVLSAIQKTFSRLKES